MADPFYRIVNTGVGTGVRMTNTMHIAKSGGLGTLSVADINAAIVDIANFYSLNAPYHAPGTIWNIGTRVLQYDLDNLASPPVIIGATPVTATTGSGAASLPSACAIVVSWRTPFAGPAWRGRTFLGPIAVGATANGLVSPAIASTIQTRANTLLTDLAANTVPTNLVVFSRVTPAKPPIIAATVDTTVDNLSTRKF